MNDARQCEVIGYLIPVVGDEIFQPDGVDFALRVVLVQEYLDIV
jgi:hypothetical protein